MIQFIKNIFKKKQPIVPLLKDPVRFKIDDEVYFIEYNEINSAHIYEVTVGWNSCFGGYSYIIYKLGLGRSEQSFEESSLFATKEEAAHSLLIEKQ